MRKPKEFPSLEEFEKNDNRGSLVVVLQNHTVWKKLYFESVAQAHMVVKRFHPKIKFLKDGNALVNEKTGYRFTAYEILQYTKMDDVKFCFDNAFYKPKETEK